MKLLFLLVAWCALGFASFAQEPDTVRFNKNFEGGSLGKIEVLPDDHFRCQVLGQQNEHGRNRQPTWYYFRLEAVRGRAITLTLTDFIGEYDRKPAVAMKAELRPVFSYDGEHWQHFEEAAWDDTAKEMTLRFTPEQDQIYIAHAQPYTHGRLLRLLEELRGRPGLNVQEYGRTTLGRPLHLLIVTDNSVPATEKRCVWLQARQHAWESGTSWTMDGALRFITSDDPAAQALRKKVIFKFTPMVDPDGTVLGNVRFNVNGYDVNRHWAKVDINSEADRQRMAEIWHTKKTILAEHAKQPVALLINMHNTEVAEYLDTQVDSGYESEVFTRVFRQLRETTRFDPSRVPLTGPNSGRLTSNDLWTTDKIPVALMELRIGPSQKLGRRPTAEDRVKFGAELIRVMGEAVAK